MEPFALGERDSARIVDGLLAGVGDAPFSVHLVSADEHAALLSLQVAADVFLDAFGNTPDLLRREYAHLLPSMTHVVVLDTATRTAVGSVILQESAAEELKTVVDAAQPPWSVPVQESLAALGLAPGSRTAADLLLLAVRPSHRNRSLAPLLCYAGWAVSARRGVERWTAILDDALLGGLNGLTGGAMRPIGDAGSRPYLGSAGSTPVSIGMNPAEDVALLRRMQRVGVVAGARAVFCDRLEPAHRAFQALGPAPARASAPALPRDARTRGHRRPDGHEFAGLGTAAGAPAR